MQHFSLFIILIWIFSSDEVLSRVDNSRCIIVTLSPPTSSYITHAPLIHSIISFDTCRIRIFQINHHHITLPPTTSCITRHYSLHHFTAFIHSSTTVFQIVSWSYGLWRATYCIMHHYSCSSIHYKLYHFLASNTKVILIWYYFSKSLLESHPYNQASLRIIHYTIFMHI